MNKHNAKDYLPFVQALADGKTIEWLTETNHWATLNDGDFVLPATHYRIVKPTPTPTITPGKWRMRNGEVVDVVKSGSTLPTHAWTNTTGGVSWCACGAFMCDGTESELDLLTKVETRWRPWKPEEVPLGREVRKKNSHTTRALVTGAQTCGFALSLLVVKYVTALEEWELLNPDGTYSPCGVEEEVS